MSGVDVLAVLDTAVSWCMSARGSDLGLTDARAAVAELIEAGRELIDSEAEYHRLANKGQPAAPAWNRVTAARHRHAAALARVQGGAE